MTTLQTKLRIGDWDESAVEEFEDGRKITCAHVRLRDGVDGLDSGSAIMLAFYRPDGTSDYVTLLHLFGRLDGNEGTFALRGEGGYDGTRATGRMSVVPGSGTGGLAGISGSCLSESTQSDYPFMPLILNYQLA
jgi:hypothetical protein